MRFEFLLPDSEIWQRILGKVRHDFYHIPGYCQLDADYTGGTPVAFYAEDEKDRQFLLPMIIRPISLFQNAGSFYDAISPYGYPGPLIHCPEMSREAFTAAALAGLKTLLNERGVIALFIRFHPIFEVPSEPFRTIGVLVKTGESVSMDLSLPEDIAWAQICPDHRRKIKKACAGGAEAFIDDSWKYFDDFEQLYLETMTRNHASKYYFFPHSYLQRLKDILEDRLQLCIVRKSGQIAAAGLITETNGIVQGYLNGTNINFKQSSPSLLIYDFVRRWAKGRGNKLFHLGSGIGGAHDTLFEFKARFSPLRHPFYSWRLIVNETAYWTLVREWEFANGETADSEIGFFPAYRKISFAVQAGGRI